MKSNQENNSIHIKKTINMLRMSNLKNKRFSPYTKKGYDLFEASSSLQKSIRRGLEKEALYWAWELELSNYGKYLWKRLLIISIEDIGPASTTATARVQSYSQVYNELKKQKSRETCLPITAAIIHLCRCDKSRLFDWAKCWMVETHDQQNLSIPDYALDKHTRRGKQMGKTIEDFFETGCKLTRHAPANNEEEYMKAARKFYCELSPEERDCLRTCKTLPEGHPDMSSSVKHSPAPQQQVEMF